MVARDLAVPGKFPKTHQYWISTDITYNGFPLPNGGFSVGPGIVCGLGEGIECEE